MLTVQNLLRMLPPGNQPSGVNPNPAYITVNGRYWSCAQGSTIDVPFQDGLIMQANGWVAASLGGAGPTANRPTDAPKNAEYLDTTLGYIVRYDGATWRNPASGAAV